MPEYTISNTSENLTSDFPRSPDLISTEKLQDIWISQPTDENDIGVYIKNSNGLPDVLKIKLLEKPFSSFENYNFKKDSTGAHSFLFSWLNQYSPWLGYSTHLK